MDRSTSSPTVSTPLDTQVAPALDYLRRLRRHTPNTVLILGTGLGELAEELEAREAIDYADLPGFVAATAEGHCGRLLLGTWRNHPVAVLDGRCHLYEGYSFAEVVFPIHVLARLGARRLIVSNASGGLNPFFRSGEVMVVADHLNLMFRNVNACDNSVAKPERPRSWVSPYDARLTGTALALARRHGHVAHEGVYAAVLGPNYETRAEYRMLRRLGADAVGMSTVPEVLVAARMGLQVLGLSAITNVALPDQPREVSHGEVIDWAANAAPAIRVIMAGICEQQAS